MSAELTAAAGKLHDQMQQATSSLREIGRHPRGMPLSGEAGSELAYLVARLAIELEALQRAQSPVDAPAMQPPAGDAVRAPADECAPGIGHLNPRVSLDEDGTLDDFAATGVETVHLEALDDTQWYATVVLANGEVWQLNFGAHNPRAKGYARAERVQ